MSTLFVHILHIFYLFFQHWYAVESISVRCFYSIKIKEHQRASAGLMHHHTNPLNCAFVVVKPTPCAGLVTALCKAVTTAKHKLQYTSDGGCCEADAMRWTGTALCKAEQQPARGLCVVVHHFHPLLHHFHSLLKTYYILLSTRLLTSIC